MQAGAGPPDLAGHQRERDQAAGVVGAVHVLADAHAPEDDRALGGGVGARDGAQGLGIDAADRRHPLRRERLQVLAQVLEALGVRLDVLAVVQLLLDDHVHERVQQRDVGAGLELQHVRGVALQRLAARVHDDQRLAALGRLLEVGRGDRMVLGRIGADHDDHLGVLDRGERRGDRARADVLEQRCHGAGVAQPRAVIDVVRAEAGADQLLDQIGLLVRAFGRAEAGERTRAVALADRAQARGGDVQRLLPARLAEVAVADWPGRCRRRPPWARRPCGSGAWSDGADGRRSRSRSGL